MAELGQLRDAYDRFQARKVNVVALSADPPEINARVQERERLPFPVLSDSQLEFCRSVGLFHAEGHGGEPIARPASLLIDDSATVLWTFQGRTVQERLPVDRILEVVHSLTTEAAS